MNLDRVTAEIRPRGRWESIDLGCALVRENYGKIMSAWFMTVVPFWCVIIGLCQLWPAAEGRPWLAGFICLWVLPMCDRVPLFILSRRLFGEDSNWKELLRAFPRMIVRRWFMTLLLGPFAVGRGLSQPVLELEGLKGKAYRERVSLLSRNGGEGATRACLISLVLVLATMFSMLFVVFGFLGLFGDSVALETFWVEHVLESDASFMAVPYVWVMVGLMLSALTLIEPFYVGAGFSMYINSRTVTEGWDIELAFKRMNKRVNSVMRNTSKSLLVLLFSFLSVGVCSTGVEASNARLDEVMQHEDFKIHTEIIKTPKELDGGSDRRAGGGAELTQFIAALVAITFWVLVTAAVVALLWLLYRNRYMFSAGGRASRSKKGPVLRTVMGMDVTPESLPEDIITASRGAWDRGEFQQAVSLLYRGAISCLVHEMQVNISESDTEQDCVVKVEERAEAAQSVYFGSLTKSWEKLAYGKVTPSESNMVELWNTWPYSKSLERSEG